MKTTTHIALLLMSLGMPAVYADNLIPNGSSDELVSITDGQFLLIENMEYTNVHFYVDSAVTSLVFDGQSSYGLTLVKDDNDTIVSAPENNKRHLIYKNDYTSGQAFNLVFRNLTGLRLDGSLYPDYLRDGGGIWLTGSSDMSVDIRDILGDVYLGGFNDSSAIGVQSRLDATVSISGVAGKVSVVDNKTTNMSHYSPGIFAWSHGAGEAKVILSDIQGGIELSRNQNSGDNGISATSQEGSALISIRNISGGILMEDNSNGSGYGILNVVGNNDALLEITDVSGPLVFRNNTTGMYGSVMIASCEGDGAVFLTLQNISGDILFENNSAGILGGAIFFLPQNSTGSGALTIANISGDVTFRGNAAGTNGGGAGGAIASLSDSDATEQQRTYINLSADGGNIIFEGNTAVGTANAIYAQGLHSLSFRAREEKSILFLDPIVMARANTGQDSTLDLNQTKDGIEYTGTIVFSGEYWKNSGNAEDMTSEITGRTTLYNGKWVIEQGAILSGDGSPDYSVTIEKGVLEMTTQGTLNTGVFTLASEAVLRTGNGAYLSATTVDMSRGFRWDLAPFISGNNSGLNISNAQTFSLGGIISIIDNIYFYRDTRWLEEQKHLVLSLDTASYLALFGPGPDLLEEGLSLISEEFNSSLVSSGYVYDGMWSLIWEDEDLYALWSPDPGQGPEIDPYPEPEPGPDPKPEPGPGSYEGSPLNSLWSTLSNVNILKNTVRGQLGLQCVGQERDARYWAMGLADFSRHQTVGMRDGYEYSGWGYAVGADAFVQENFITGIAFGNIYGTNKSRSYDSEIKQESYMGMLYGVWAAGLNKANTLRLEWSAAYGHTDNTQKSHYKDRGASRGTWDNNVFQLALEAAWDTALSENWTLTPFIGIEYAGAHEKAFTETGDRDIHYGKAQLRNLSLPMGVGVTHVRQYGNGMAWINQVTASYIPDVYRKNPTAAAREGETGTGWDVYGSSVARNGGRIEWNTRWVINREWSLFGGYSFEGRSHAFYHGGNVGVSLSF